MNDDHEELGANVGLLAGVALVALALVVGILVLSQSTTPVDECEAACMQCSVCE